MKSYLLFLTVVVLVVGYPAALAVADWYPGDGHKMHFPQLPDEDGWDVNASWVPGIQAKQLADDWRCSQTGDITDIHWWGSHEYGHPVPPFSFIIEIYSDDPVGPGGSDPDNEFSKPDAMLWDRYVPYSELSVVQIDQPTPQQGWYDPNTGVWRHPDHSTYYQYNLTDIVNPCPQYEDTIYWLAITAQVMSESYLWGWKTADVDQYPAPYTGEHYMDDAVWRDFAPPTPWAELYDPRFPPPDQVSLDLAFVITPEPASLSLLALGGLVVLLRRRR